MTRTSRSPMIALALAAALLVVLAAALVTAQDSGQGSDEPTLNESDMDASTPPPDESYMDDGNDVPPSGAREGSNASNGSDPSLHEGEMDASVPPEDDAFLEDEYGPPAQDEAGAPATWDTLKVPGPALLGVLAALGVALAATRR